MTLAFVALVVVTTFAVSVSIESVVRRSVLQREVALRLAGAENLMARLNANVMGVRRDVLAIADQASTAKILMDAAGAEADRHRLGQQFATLLEANPAYRQCRILSAEGMEVVRVDRSGAGADPRILTPDELQNKSARGYVSQTLAIGDGELYYSRIDLNREDGRIETPEWPVLRVATPIFSDDGERRLGLVIINVDMGEAFETLRRLALPGELVYVVDDEGNFLVHPDRSREFGFEYGRAYLVRDEFSETAGRQATLRVDGEEYYMASAGGRLAGGPRVALYVGHPSGVLLASVSEVFRASVLAALPVLALGAAAAFVISRSLTKPIEQLTVAARTYTAGEPFGAPQNGSEEIRVLSRTLQSVLEAIDAQTASLENEVATRQRAEERFRGTIEAAPNGILMTDTTGTIVLVNAEVERLFGYERSELIGQSVEMLIPQKARGAHASYRTEYAKKPERREMGKGRDLYGIRKNGTPIPLEIGLNPLETPEGKVFLATIADITERQRARERLTAYAQSLEQSNSDLERFAYVVSHDLKSPLRGMANVAAWLREDLGDDIDDDARENIDLMIDRADRLTQLIDGILQYSRVSRYKAAPVRLSVHQVVETVIGSLEIPAGVTVRIEGRLPEIVYDETQLEQVFQNLIDNAVRHLERADGEVVVSGERLPGAWRFSVRDNGPGIDERHFERIFGMFQTLTTSSVGRSTGIGLSIVKRIVERNGGKIDVKSTVGEGAEFTFTTPAESVGPSEGVV